MSSAGLIWDLPGTCPQFEGQVLHWHSAVECADELSVPAYLEAHAVRIRGRYLAFVHDLGALEIGGRPVCQHMEDVDGNNFWWMGLIAEKSPFKTPEIYQALRLLALEDLLRDKPVQSLALRTCDAALAGAVRALCECLGIPFSCELQSPRRAGLLARLRQTQGWSGWLQAPLAAVVHLWRRLPLRRVRPLPWHQGQDAVLMCSYFAHLDLSAAGQGRFESRQWGPLPGLLAQCGLRLNWLQNYWPSEAAVNAGAAVLLARRFNAASAAQGLHGFVDSYLGWRVLGRALRSWLTLCRRAWALRSLPACLRSGGLPAYLWPVLQPAWASSLTGRVGMANCISVHLFDAALRDLPRQSRGFYLFENQAWEKAFLTAWRRHGHGAITGVVHATVPFWHLYYAEDARSLQPGFLPQPDAIAVNGEASRQALLAQGYGASRLVPAEALRYLDLAQARSQGGGEALGVPGQTRVLIVGDMERDALRALLSTVKQAQGMLPAGYRFAFKPHPAYPLDPKQAVGLDIAVVAGALPALLPGYDCVIAGNSTSACVDAFLGGKPVIIGTSGQYLNLSPLRGQPSVAFFESPQQLVASLLDCGGRQVQVCERDEYFYLDGELTRWRKLLGLPQAGGSTAETNGNESDRVVSEYSI